MGSATVVLGQISNGSNEMVVERLCENLTNSSSWVRRRTINSLGLVAKKGDKRIIDAIALCLADPCHTVRLEAAKSLPLFDDGKLQSYILHLLIKDDPNVHVMHALMKAREQCEV